MVDEMLRLMFIECLVNVMLVWLRKLIIYVVISSGMSLWNSSWFSDVFVLLVVDDRV